MDLECADKKHRQGRCRNERSCMYAYENNAIISNKTAYKQKLPIMLQSEMLIQEVVKNCTSIRSADGSQY